MRTPGTVLLKTKAELLERHREKKDTERRRLIQEGQVIEALPEGVGLLKAYTSSGQVTNGRAAAHGHYEFEAADTVALLGWLLALPPAETVAVRMERNGGAKTTSFYPLARVPRKWQDEHEVIYCEPYIWQASPKPRQQCEVVVEWYVEPRPGLFVLCRCRLLSHRASYVRNGVGREHGAGYKLVNAPSGVVRKVGLFGDTVPYFVSVYWFFNSFTGPQEFCEHLKGGPTQNA